MYTEHRGRNYSLVMSINYEIISMPQVMFAMNSEKSETTNDSAYNLVFGMAPHSRPGCASHVGDETDCDSDGIDDEFTTSQPTSSPYDTSTSRPIPAPRLQNKSAAATPGDAAPKDGILNVDDKPSDPTASRPVPIPRPRTTIAAAVTDDTTRVDGAGDKDADDVPQSTSAWSEQRSEARKRAHAATLKSAERMSAVYNSNKKRRVQTFVVGDNVSVAIPALDRTSTDVRRLPGQVTAVKGDKVQMYEVATEYGLLQTKLRAGDLQSYSGDLNINTTRYNSKDALII